MVLLERARRPEGVFTLTAAFFGVLFLVITPPFQVPDEINHLCRAYQISEGHFLSVQIDDRLGGEIPHSLVEFTNSFRKPIGDRLVKIRPRTILEASSLPLNSSTREFVDFPNASAYSPVSYLPQSIALALGRACGLGPFHLFYSARAAALLFWIVCVSLAIRIIPFHKWLLTFTALLPMSVWINMSLSADVVSNALSFLLLALLLHLAYSAPSVSERTYALVLGLASLLAFAKIVYAPIALLFLLIPRSKFPNTRAYCLQLFLLVVIPLSVVLYWTHTTEASFLPYARYNAHFRDQSNLMACADVHEQMQYILDHGTYILSVLAASIVEAFNMYSTGYIGTFGWLDTRLPTWLILLCYIVLLAVAIGDTQAVRMPKRHRILLVFSGAIMFGLVLFSQHLIWDCVGSSAVHNVQGRYLIPLVPLLFMSLLRTSTNPSRYLPAVVVLVSLFALGFSAMTLVDRYYPVPRSGPTAFMCDAERLTDDGYFETSDDRIMLENGATQNTDRSRSGRHAVRMDPRNPYAFTYRLYDAVEGDTIHIAVWRYGSEGRVKVCNNDRELLSDNGPSTTDTAGWQLLELDVPVLTEMATGEIGVFLHYDGPEHAFFDDLSISHR